MRFTFVTSVTFGRRRGAGHLPVSPVCGCNPVLGERFVGSVQDFGNEGLILDECETGGRFGSTECQFD